MKQSESIQSCAQREGGSERDSVAEMQTRVDSLKSSTEHLDLSSKAETHHVQVPGGSVLPRWRVPQTINLTHLLSKISETYYSN